MSPSSVELEAAALAVPCERHHLPPGAECPGGGACMNRYGARPVAFDWFGHDSSGLPDPSTA